MMEWCCMCKKSKESIDHLLHHCKVARDLWVSVFRLFGMEWVVSQWMVELLASWRGRIVNHRNIEVWRTALMYLMWCIWREHNA
jgi:hypothetical protein